MNKILRCAIIVLIAVAGASLVAWAGSGHSQQLGNLPLYGSAVGLALLIQWIAFIPSLLAQTEKYYDLVGGISYITITSVLLLATPNVSVNGWIAGFMVILWSARLATFLFKRVLNAGDGRFDDIKVNPPRLLLTWTLQGFWVALVASGAWIVITSEKQPGLTWISIIGIVIWLFGFLLEVIADSQKSAFKKDPANAGQFIDVGLWSHSRHPNYFGEIVLWTGMFIFAIPHLSGGQWIAILSPVFTTFLLAKVSGIPMLEKRADTKWGGQAEYEAYKERTPVLIPKLTA